MENFENVNFWGQFYTQHIKNFVVSVNKIFLYSIFSDKIDFVLKIFQAWLDFSKFSFGQNRLVLHI